MAETPPLNEPVNAKQSSAPVVLRILLIILLAVPGFAGLIALAIAFVWWSSNGFYFTHEEGGWSMILILPGIVCVLFSVITIGIVLRFARWRRAPVLSLVLAIIAIVCIIVTHGLVLSAFSFAESIDRFGLLLLSALVATLSALPPFLHWWKANNKVE